MKDRGWVEQDTLELTRWIPFIRELEASGRTKLFEMPAQFDWQQFSRSVAQIRHCAVHRDPRNVGFLSESLRTSQTFAKLHRNTVMAEEFDKLERLCQEVFDEYASRQTTLKRGLQNRLGEIIAQAKELEAKAIESFERQQEQHQSDASDRLVSIIERSLVRQTSKVEQENYLSDDFDDPAIELIKVWQDDKLMKRSPAEFQMGGQHIEKAFQQQGAWQLLRCINLQHYTCSRCAELKTSKMIAFEVSKRDLPLCNRCYSQCLAKWRKSEAF